jgi:hypothetical protein
MRQGINNLLQPSGRLTMNKNGRDIYHLETNEMRKKADGEVYEEMIGI